MIAEINQICTNLDATKIWLLEQGARLSPTQAQQFNTLMMGHENDLRYAEKAYLVVDRVAEPDSKQNQTFILEDGTSNVNDEAEDVTNAFICLADFGLASFGDDQFSVTSEDYNIFLADLRSQNIRR